MDNGIKNIITTQLKPENKLKFKHNMILAAYYDESLRIIFGKY